MTSQMKSADTQSPSAAWTRESEDALVKLCVNAANENKSPASADEADIFRLVAQLVKTTHPAVAAALESLTKTYFDSHRPLQPRSFPDVVQAGLVRDLPRVRNLLERQLSGRRTW
ncbi:hypothetical protein [Glaciimonas immobilis]|uniref:Uncharacterized protein n=1 Tax=Glaciimonas immobilis TaxID=728004 RepID=A0A840S0Z8_9BURK|nr:hypothetical protein [Glaciimonas immobilis]KAF3997215.1 hypothetical protein HAV38_16300 [Glaciimonas immobilis]MBB5202259.1 hypothetical protein [Glaciimonas immobilis]